jgi:hypothetical protein
LLAKNLQSATVGTNEIAAEIEETSAKMSKLGLQCKPLFRETAESSAEFLRGGMRNPLLGNDGDRHL